MLLTENNKIELFTDGHQLFDKVIEDIYNAKDYIHLGIIHLNLMALEIVLSMH